MKKIALALLAVVAMGAQASDDGVYIGVSENHVKIEANGASDSTNAIGVYGGYRMGAIAAELSRAQKTIDGVKFVHTEVAAIPHYSVAKDFDVIGKLGIRHSEVSEIGNASGTSLVVGAGVQYTVLPQMTVRALVDYSNRTYGESIKATTTTLGVAYKF
jgi:opacity protein-like surface antigen